MKKIAFVFGGQGTQFVGMGRDIFDSSEYRKYFDPFLEGGGETFFNLLFHGEDDQLSRTLYAQPAIFTISMILLQIFVDQHPNISCEGVLGHSLGEYSAYVASGILKQQDAYSLVKERATLMEESCLQHEGRMLAVLKLPYSILKECMSEYVDVEIANYNTPEQFVLSGSRTSLDQMIPILRQKGGRGILLKVKGAFHSSYMKSSALKFQQGILPKYQFNIPQIPLYTNFTGDVLENNQVKDNLYYQLFSSVQFTKGIESMIRDQFDCFIEFSPTIVLKNMIKKINPEIQVYSITSVEDIMNFNKE